MEKRKVLIAEDEPMTSSFLHDFLKARTDIILLPIAPHPGPGSLRYMGWMLTIISAVNC